MAKIDYELVYKVAGDLLVSQTEQLKLWKGDDVCLDKLENICLDFAGSLYVKLRERIK